MPCFAQQKHVPVAAVGDRRPTSLLTRPEVVLLVPCMCSFVSSAERCWQCSAAVPLACLDSVWRLKCRELLHSQIVFLASTVYAGWHGHKPGKGMENEEQ